MLSSFLKKTEKKGTPPNAINTAQNFSKFLILSLFLSLSSSLFFFIQYFIPLKPTPIYYYYIYTTMTLTMFHSMPHHSNSTMTDEFYNMRKQHNKHKYSLVSKTRRGMRPMRTTVKRRIRYSSSVSSSSTVCSATSSLFEFGLKKGNTYIFGTHTHISLNPLI